MFLDVSATISALSFLIKPLLHARSLLFTYARGGVGVCFFGNHLVAEGVSFVLGSDTSEIMASDWSADLEELRHLQSIAKRPRVLSIISAEIQSLEKAQCAAEARRQVNVAPLQTSTAASSEIRYTTLSSFSWDQDDERLKIYVSLEGVNEDKVVSNFQPWSFDVKFHDIQGKNYRCAVPKLNKTIVPGKCRVVVKPHRVIITLHKGEKGNWSDIYYKEDKLKPKLDDNKDPMAGIMDLMKNMYEEGDDDLKRTMAKAWSEARSGKQPDPLKGYGGGL